MMELSLMIAVSGEEAEFDDYVYECGRRVMGHVKQEVAMVITAPRGRAVILKPIFHSRTYDAYVPQAEAIKAFMEQHRGD